ncbi:MAG: hypothetical protein QOG65_3643 [Actinomycetota bacterium]|nr:hypothetical protein [Actinomycetota bacterium]
MILTGNKNDVAKSDRRARQALAAFVLVEATALPVLVALGRSVWFTADEWDFVAHRTAWNLDDLFRPHNEHWSTLPILVYRLLWWLFGLRTHLPHLIIALVLHLTVAALLRAVMRQAAVGPWLATIAASAFVWFGAGYFNAEFAFQMAWCAALAFGLGYLLLVLHDGPFDRRDVIGLLLGLASLMCAGPGVATTIVVVLAVFLRRGYRLALLHAAPLGASFLIWWAAIGRGNYSRHASLVDAARFMGRNLWATFRSLGSVPGAGAALVILLGTGLALQWTGRRRATEAGSQSASQSRSWAGPVAMLVGAPLFLFITGIGRGAPSGPFGQASNVSRYLHVAGALVLPALALAADTVVKRWRSLAPAVAATLAIGIPGNIGAFVDGTHGLVEQTRGERSFILSAARNPVAPRLPRTMSPYFASADLTMGWLLDSVRSGRVPPTRPLTPDELATQTLSLALRPPRAPLESCRRLENRRVFALRKGQSLRVASGRVDMIYLAPGGARSLPARLPSATMTALVGPLRLQLVPRPPGAAFAFILCG